MNAPGKKRHRISYDSNYPMTHFLRNLFLKNPTDSLLILLAFRKFPQEAMKNSRDFWIWKENVDFYDVKHLFVCHKEL